MDTILVVDDEEKIRRAVRGVLADEGFAVAEAADGRRALDLIAQARPRLCIVDIWMPELDGIELVTKIRERAPGLPVIVISGHVNVETALRVAQLGAFHFLEKPFTLDALLASVARALGRSAPVVAERATAVAARGADARRATQAERGARPQRTLGRGVAASGLGLHTGAKTGLILQPLPPDSGIVFGNITS